MKKIMAFLLATCFSVPVFAEYADGEKAFNEQRWLQAYSEFLPLADAGDFRSQYYVGYLYLYGYGVPQNAEKALSYLNKSAEQNYDMAEAQLAYLYANGTFVPKDKKRAMALYQKAAERGNASALLNLGVIYYTGDGVSKDVKKAIDYFLKVSPKEKPIVAKYLGDIYLNEGSVSNPQKAFSYYTMAAAAGDIGAFHLLGHMYQNGIYVNKSINDAIRFYTYAAAKNYAPSQYALGVIYANGDGVSRDNFKAHAWFSLAAEQDMDEAEKAKQKLEEKMSLSDREKASRAMIEIQQQDLKTAHAPVVAQTATQKTATKPTPVRTTIRRRRR